METPNLDSLINDLETYDRMNMLSDNGRNQLNEYRKIKQGNRVLLRVSGSAFTEDEEKELQRLVRKIKYQQYTYADMEKADELTWKKWKSQGIG